MQNQLSELKVKVDTCSRNFGPLVPSAHIRYICAHSMIAHAALKLKDTFAPRFASIQSVLDSMEVLENYEVILAIFSSSCVYMLSLS